MVGAGVTYVQVARDHDELDATISRLWFFLAVGVAGGSILATLAGLAVAGRAMRPIAALTSTAREIAATRDPARTMPKPEAEDEVAELATTLDEMLRELDAARNEAQGMVQARSASSSPTHRTSSARPLPRSSRISSSTRCPRAKPRRR